ncbi:MAG TPA: hypothetical protein VGJ60_15405 [Chloroflexota bacterium]
MLDWLDLHSGSIVGASTIVLVLVTAYYAWTTRALVRETRATLKGANRATLQERLDRISVICIQNPSLFQRLDDDTSTGEEQDGRFHISNMFLGVLEEAYMQHHLEHSMSDDDWSAWVATADAFLPKVYVVHYWQRVAPTFEPGFQRFINERQRAGAN